jgi:hypothetical protein
MKTETKSAEPVAKITGPHHHKRKHPKGRRAGCLIASHGDERFRKVSTGRGIIFRSLPPRSWRRRIVRPTVYVVIAFIGSPSECWRLRTTNHEPDHGFSLYNSFQNCPILDSNPSRVRLLSSLKGRIYVTAFREL